MAIQAFWEAAAAEEAVRLRRESPVATRFIAGGTDLLLEETGLSGGVVSVREALRYVRREKDEFVIGAAATVSMLLEWRELAEEDHGFLRACARDFASWQIRNMATVGGNLASAVPSADFAPPLLVLEARIVVLGDEGRREMPLAELFVGPHQSALGSDLLVEIRFTAPGRSFRYGWQKTGRTDGDIAIASAAAALSMRNGVVDNARLALGAVAPTPHRVGEAEKYLIGKRPTDKHLAKAASLAREGSRPIDDQRASAAYRSHVSEVLVRRALADAAREGGER